jgi:hypothetical protein
MIIASNLRRFCELAGFVRQKRWKKDSIYVPSLLNKRWHRLPPLSSNEPGTSVVYISETTVLWNEKLEDRIEKQNPILSFYRLIFRDPDPEKRKFFTLYFLKSFSASEKCSKEFYVSGITWVSSGMRCR